MTLETLFHEHLDIYYRRGSPCLFYPDKYGWQELCHIVPQSKANRKLCARAFGLSDMIDMPMLNVIPGSRAANHEEYCNKIVTLPPAVMCAARSAILDYAKKRPAILNIAIVDEFMRAVPMLVGLLEMQAKFQFALQEALHGI